MDSGYYPFNPDGIVKPEDFVGRQAALDFLQRKLESAVQQGAPKLAMVTGMRGVGKSSLIKFMCSDYWDSKSKERPKIATAAVLLKQIDGPLDQRRATRALKSGALGAGAPHKFSIWVRFHGGRFLRKVNIPTP